MAYNSHEVNKMNEKEKLFSLIDRLTSDEISALGKIVNSMVSSRKRTEYPEEELTQDEERKLDAAIKEIEKGDFARGDNLDELFN